MPASKKSSARASSGKVRRERSEDERDEFTQNFDVYSDEDDDYEKIHNTFRDKLGMPPIDGSSSRQKRKRVLTSKAKAALENDESSDGSIEPDPKRKSVARGKKLATSYVKKDPGVRPDDTHPASLVRLKSPFTLRSSNTPPPKFKRKYDSYRDAAVAGSGGDDDSSGGDDDSETMASREEEMPSSAVATDGGSLSGDDSGSLVDFIDDRAEAELSVDSADSFEEPSGRKSRSSKKRRPTRVKPAASPTRPSHQGKAQQEKAKPFNTNEAIVISDESEDELNEAQPHRHHKSSKGYGNFKEHPERSEEEASFISSKGFSSKHRPPTQDRIEGRSREHRDKKPARHVEVRKADEGKRHAKKVHPNDEDWTSPPPENDARKRQPRTRRAAVDQAPDKEEPTSDVPIDWPSSPERPPKRRPKKTSRVHGKKKMGEDEMKQEDVKPEVELLPGQDILLAETYVSMEPLKHVDLIPLFGSQDPPEEEALKLTELLRVYETTPASTYLPKRLKDLILFQQQGVLVNPSRASLNRVTTSGYGTSTYYIVPTSVVRPRSGSLPFYACFLATGVCAYCYLFRPAEKNLGSRSIVDHRIGVYPVEFEYQRGLTYMANVSKKTSIRYSFTSGILAFTSKTEGSSDSNNTNFGASPKKSAFHRDRTVPPSQLSAANPNLEHLRTSRFPAALSYADNVPVFDARGSNFLTGTFDLSTLHTLPLITEDIEESSVVTVGYTSNTYVSSSGSLAGVEVLSMNVQFVVVHAGAPP